MRLVLVAAFTIAPWTAGCTSAPSEPTWTDDVAPILQANCVRCHGRTPRGGAPSDFRLDIYEGRGAGLMAPFAAERAHTETMPPVTPLASVQIDTLSNWVANGAPRGEPDANNQPPAIFIENFRGDDTLIMPYVISDPDFDVVSGGLFATPLGTDAPFLIDSTLHSGAGEATWFVASVPDGDYELFAELSDPHVTRQYPLGRQRIVHDNGTAPALAIVSPPVDTIATDDASPLTVSFTVADPDSGETNDVTVFAVRGNERIELGQATDLAPGQHDVDVDTTAITAGPNWSIVVESGVSSARVGGLVIARQTTALRYTDVQPILATYCDPCHSANETVNIPFQYNFGAQYASIASFIGPTYRRVALEQSMPPRSAETLFDGFERIPESERARLAEWLLGGGPE